MDVQYSDELRISINRFKYPKMNFGYPKMNYGYP